MTIPSIDFDVAVVGGGPGGSAAAKRCGEHGLKTVLLEKHRLPRDKVCTGMIMGRMAQTLVQDEFGHLPTGVLTTPPHLRGFKFYAPKVKNLTLEHSMPFAWRRDFDFWLNQVAHRTGVELWDKTKVKAISDTGDSYVLSFERAGKAELLRTRFLVGADGTISVVRRILFPEEQMKLQLNLRYCYQGQLDLESEFVHFFYFPDLTGFAVNFKGDVFLLEMALKASQGNGARTLQEAEVWLAQNYGFTLGQKPLWRDGCFEPAMGKPPFSGPFPLAKNNALIVGNAAGLNVPITGEGIGTAIKSGLMAADAIIKANEKGRTAADFYLPAAQDILSTINAMYPPPGKLGEEAKRGMDCFLRTLRDIFSKSVTIS